MNTDTTAGEGIENSPEAMAAGQTGPKTEEGKQMSSKNALKHGLSARKAENAVDPELKAQYDTLHAGYVKEFKPVGAIENSLLDMIVLSVWQLYKVSQMELFSELSLGGAGSLGQSERLARYRASHERSLHKNLSELRQIQQERLLRETGREAQIPVHIPPAVRLNALLGHLKEMEKKPRARTAGAAVSTSRPMPPYQRRKPMGMQARVSLMPRG